MALWLLKRLQIKDLKELGKVAITVETGLTTIVGLRCDEIE